MGNPVRLASDAQYSPGADTSTLTSSAATVGTSNGEVIVVKLTTWSNADGMNAPTGGGQTYQLAQLSAPVGFKSWSATYVCTVTGSPGSFSISSSPATLNNTRHMMVVERWGSAFLDPTPAVLGTTQGSTAPMVAAFTTTAPNSVFSWAMCDLNSLDPAGCTYQPAGSTQTGLLDAHLGSNSVHYSACTGIIASAGAGTLGVTPVTGNYNWAASGVEIKAAPDTFVDLSVNFTATGSMTAALVSEVSLAASFTATGGMSATLTPDPVDLAVNFTATGGMSATLNVPVLGPVDPIATPVANQLLACLTDQMNTLVSPPERIQLRVGTDTGPLIGPNVDECCAGLAWVRVADVYPSWNNFPGPDNDWLPCGPLAYAVVLEMGSAFCMPWSDSDDTFDNIDPPSTQDWETAFTTLMQHQTLMRRAAACCFHPTQRRAVGEWAPLPVEGGCTGGTLRVTVSVMAPCGDC